jgi:hypothetical protein
MLFSTSQAMAERALIYGQFPAHLLDGSDFLPAIAFAPKSVSDSPAAPGLARRLAFLWSGSHIPDKK